MADDRREYVGDGVYVLEDGRGGVWLHANDLHSPTDRVYLEQQVIDSLVRVLKDWGYVRG